MAFKMKGSAFKLGNVATRSALKDKQPHDKSKSITNQHNRPGEEEWEHNVAKHPAPNPTPRTIEKALYKPGKKEKSPTEMKSPLEGGVSTEKMAARTRESDAGISGKIRRKVSQFGDYVTGKTKRRKTQKTKSLVGKDMAEAVERGKTQEKVREVGKKAWKGMKEEVKGKYEESPTEMKSSGFKMKGFPMHETTSALKHSGVEFAKEIKKKDYDGELDVERFKKFRDDHDKAYPSGHTHENSPEKMKSPLEHDRNISIGEGGHHRPGDEAGIDPVTRVLHRPWEMPKTDEQKAEEAAEAAARPTYTGEELDEKMYQDFLDYCKNNPGKRSEEDMRKDKEQHEEEDEPYIPISERTEDTAE